MKDLEKILENIYPNQMNKVLNKHKEIKNKIILKTLFLNDNVKASERIYCILNKITQIPKCQNPKCSNKTKFKQFSYGYNKYCCCSCNAKCTVSGRTYTDKWRENLRKDKIGDRNPQYGKTGKDSAHYKWWNKLSKNEKEKINKKISRGVIEFIKTLSKEERKEKFGWMNKLNVREHKIAVQKMLETGCHLWKKMQPKNKNKQRIKKLVLN